MDESVLVRTSSPPDAVVAWGPRSEDVADVRLGSDARPLLVVLHGGFWRPEYDRAHLGPMTEGRPQRPLSPAQPVKTTIKSSSRPFRVVLQ